MTGERPDVDFDAEIVVWFGAVYGSGCENQRQDDVVIDREQALVHAEIVLVDPPGGCNDDANPRAYVVAVDRELLPAGPFAVQLGSDDPPGGAPEERTLVDVDLSVPGSVAAADEVGLDPAPPEPDAAHSGDIVGAIEEPVARGCVHFSCGSSRVMGPRHSITRAAAALALWNP